MSSSSSTQDELKQKGNDFFKNSDYLQAIEQYTAAIDKDPSCDGAAPIFSNRSLCYFTIGRYEEAFQDASRCCDIRPDWPKGFARKAVAAEKLTKYDIAKQNFEKYLTLDKSDEMDARAGKARVEAVMKKQETRKIAEQRDLPELLELLEENVDSKTDDELQATACYEFYVAAKHMVLERMKVAVKFGARLDAVFRVSDFKELGEVQTFEKKNQDKLKKEAAGGDTSVLTVANICLRALDLPYVQRSFVPLFHQIDYLNYILDLAEKQNFSFGCTGGTDNPTDSFGPIFSNNMVSDHCTHSIRTDLVAAVLRRKNIFFAPQVSMKEFATHALAWCFLDYTNSMNSTNGPFVSNNKKRYYFGDVSNDDLYACTLMCLAAGADPSPKQFKVSQGDSSVIIFECIYNFRSVHLVELLLKYNANVNREKVILPGTTGATKGQNRAIGSPLSAALERGNVAIMKLLLEHGAQLPVENLPSEFESRCPPEKHEFVESKYCPKLVTPFMNSLRLFPEFYTKEFIQCIYTIAADQKLSLVCPMPNLKVAFTPLTATLNLDFPPDVIRTICRCKPEMVNTPCFPMPGDLTHMLYPLGLIIFNVRHGQMEFDYATKVAGILMEFGATGTEKPAADLDDGEHEGSLTAVEFIDYNLDGVSPKQKKQLLQLKKLVTK